VIVTIKTKFVVEFITLAIGFSLFLYSFLNIQSIYSSTADPDNGQERIHIQVHYSECEAPSEPLLTLRKLPKINTVEVTLDFINWSSYDNNCNQIIVSTPSSVSNIEHSKQIDGVTTSSLWPINSASVTWDMLEKDTYIDINSNTAPAFAGGVRFLIPNSILTDRAGYQLASSFKVSGTTMEKDLPLFKFVKVIIEPHVKIDFTVPSIHAIDLDKWNVELTFKVDSGLETDIFTDVMVSTIDQRAMAEREITLSWLSTIMGTGFGLLVGALLALSRDYASLKLEN